MLAGINVTHSGGCTLEMFDGVPDKDGFFATPRSREGTWNGRPIWRSHPLYMGMNQLNGGFHFGLTLTCEGSVDPTASVMWAAITKKTAIKDNPKLTPPPPFDKATEVKAPSAPNSLTRMHVIDAQGTYRLSRRDCELYTVNVIRSGMASRIELYTGDLRGVFSLPAGSSPGFCSDSFPLGGFCERGLYVRCSGGAPLFAVTWREKDLQTV